MSNGKSTPGPWRYDLNHTVAVVDGEEWGVTICQVPGESGIGRGPVSEEDKANARLIAAAPDLLSSCKELLAYLTDDIPAEFLESDGGASSVVVNARATIAKATEGV